MSCMEHISKFWFENIRMFWAQGRYDPGDMDTALLMLTQQGKKNKISNSSCLNIKYWV